MESFNTTNETEENLQQDGHHPQITSKLKEPTTPIETSFPRPKLPQASPRKLIVFSLLGFGATILAIFLLRWWHYAQTHQETDNAYVRGHINPVTARISGTVLEVLVDDNQSVAKGALLVKLDPNDYRVILQQSQSALEASRLQAEVAKTNIGVGTTNAQGQTTTSQGNIDAAAATVATSEAALAQAESGVRAVQAQLTEVETNLVKAQLDYQRYAQLFEAGATPKQQLDTAKASYEVLVAQRSMVREQIQQSKALVIQAQKNLSNAQAKLESSQGGLQQANATSQQIVVNQQQYQAALAAISQAQAQVKNAQLQLSYTTIAAPVAGKIGNKTVEIGQRVQPGQTLLSVVQEQPWIIANFTETQLGKMHPGEEVEIKIDAFPNHAFKGKVDGLAPASGADFALLPPDNATGNFTKIVQRIPIKIVFELESIRGYEARITPGMSVVVAVETP
ncbi:multidrug resistance efflux pump [Synechococcus sp. PCC 7502]|uniref:HlyD family secretion protein n=1 Tax=Synechococcus sp. PCC 7502 TaxID=1173263 RepID=UPI00029F8534|nr:HlyD family secretion protein [Synechococcus sp. PCC 7502]AFY75068.1 multidrug resistance efflux pump [Synechococcus sp. PCC 7502]